MLQPLSQTQLELLEALKTKHALLGQAYEGALRALSDENNPECLVQCAHSLRELFDALPLAVVEPKKKPPDLKAKVAEVANQWQMLSGRTSVLAGGGWTGEIDQPLRKLLQLLAAFFKWFDEDHPRHSSELDSALDLYDPSGRLLPEHLRKRRGEQISSLARYMNGVAHHGKPELQRSEFAAKVAETEAVLRKLVILTPHGDRKAIDELLAAE